ncbi:hypothetical protein Ddc_12248 [Ditylenchus destructor]|nr:hypothetical protein Ddc_12248 [Ditylenchus destructor]
MNGISVKNLEIVLAMGSIYDNTLRDRVKQEIANVEAVYEYADCNPKPICLKRLDDNTEEPRQLKSGEEIKLYVVTKQVVVKKKGT